MLLAKLWLSNRVGRSLHAITKAFARALCRAAGSRFLCMREYRENANVELIHLGAASNKHNKQNSTSKATIMATTMGNIVHWSAINRLQWLMLGALSDLSDMLQAFSTSLAPADRDWNHLGLMAAKVLELESAGQVDVKVTQRWGLWMRYFWKGHTDT